MSASRYSFRRVEPADLPLVHGWRARPHVSRWWGEEPDDPDLEDLADARIAYWIASLDGRAFAFVQDYEIHGWPDHPFAFLPAGSRGLDMFIGEEDLLALGHGPALLRQHVDALFGAGVPAAGIDPAPDNAPARRAFEKAGFTTVSGPVDTPWGRAVLMTRHAAA